MRLTREALAHRLRYQRRAHSAIALGLLSAVLVAGDLVCLGLDVGSKGARCAFGASCVLAALAVGFSAFALVWPTTQSDSQGANVAVPAGAPPWMLFVAYGLLTVGVLMALAAALGSI